MFSEFELDIDKRLGEQLINRSWGGNLEIAAISALYDIGILVWELSRSGELVTPFNNIKTSDVKGLENLCLVRQWGVHFNYVRWKNDDYPWARSDRISVKGQLCDDKEHSKDHSSKDSPKASLLALPGTENQNVGHSTLSWRKKDSGINVLRRASEDFCD